MGRITRFFAITVCSDVRKVKRLAWVAACLALLASSGTASPQASPPVAQITFTKTLKGSIPEFMTLTVDAKGAATYDSHKLDEAGSPRPLQVSADTTARIFALAESLHFFRGIELETHRKVANMGLKTLAYEAGGETGRVQFNYTENHTAQQLADLLERIGNVEEQISQLEYEMKYDHLGLPEVLRQVEIGMAEHSYVEAVLMVPTLEKISSNPHYMHLAQSRAQEIMQQIREGK